MRFIKPLDEELLRSLPERYPLVITLEEGASACGFGSAVMEFYEAQGLLDKLHIVRAGLPDAFIPAGKRDILLRLCGLDAPSLAAKIEKALSERPAWHR